MTSLPLAGRTAVVTGVSRLRGIGFAVASRLAAMGANLFVQHHVAHDEAQPYGADRIDDVLAALRQHMAGDTQLEHTILDLAAPEAAGTLIDRRACRVRASGHPGVLPRPQRLGRRTRWAHRRDARRALAGEDSFHPAGHSSDEGRRVVGQVINSEGGFRRWRCD